MHSLYLRSSQYDLRLSVPSISVPSVENGFESVSFTLAKSFFCFASLLLFGRSAPLPSLGWSFHKNAGSGREQIELLHICAVSAFL